MISDLDPELQDRFNNVVDALAGYRLDDETEADELREDAKAYALEETGGSEAEFVEAIRLKAKVDDVKLVAIVSHWLVYLEQHLRPLGYLP